MKETNNLPKSDSAIFDEEWPQNWSKEIRQIFKEVAESSKDSERRRKENEKEIKAIWQQIKEVGKQIGGVSNSNGEVAESYFINSFKQYPYFAGQDFQVLEINASKYIKKLDLRGEYDLLLINGTSVAIIEIKYKAKKDDVQEIINKVENFKILYPQYKDFNIYLGLAALSMEKGAEKEAIKQGVSIVK